MADLAKRLAGPTQLTASAATVYTTPGSTTTIVRNIHVVNVDTVPRTFTLSVGADASGTRLYSAFMLSPGQTMVWTGFLVLAAAEVLQAYASAATAVNLTISGVEAS